MTDEFYNSDDIKRIFRIRPDCPSTTFWRMWHARNQSYSRADNKSRAGKALAAVRGRTVDGRFESAQSAGTEEADAAEGFEEIGMQLSRYYNNDQPKRPGKRDALRPQRCKRHWNLIVFCVALVLLAGRMR